MYITQQACWPNGKALDYESRDCRFDPCVGHPDRILSHPSDRLWWIDVLKILVVGLWMKWSVPWRLGTAQS